MTGAARGDRVASTCDGTTGSDSTGVDTQSLRSYLSALETSAYKIAESMYGSSG